MTFSLQIYSDFICPFCYVALGIVRALKKDFSIDEQWLPLEIHPETPPAGALLTEHLPHIDWDDLYRNLRIAGEPYGIVFGGVTMLANSRLALQAGECARGQGAYERFHEAVFRAYFTDIRDIGSREVIEQIAEEVGLDMTALCEALESGRYQQRLDEAGRRAHSLGISGVPAFIINDRYFVSGARPLEAFKDTLRRIASGSA